MAEKQSRRPLCIELDDAIREAITDLATKNGRSLKAEIQHALTRHLAAPPVVVVKTPVMKAASVMIQPETTTTKRTRRRPRSVNGE